MPARGCWDRPPWRVKGARSFVESAKKIRNVETIWLRETLVPMQFTVDCLFSERLGRRDAYTPCEVPLNDTRFMAEFQRLIERPMPQVTHLSHHDLETYLTRLLPADVDSATEIHLRECGSCVALLTHWIDFSTKLREIPAPRPNGKGELRRNPRFETNGSGLLQILKPFSSDWWNIRITNVSIDGMRINVPFRIPLGSFLKVKLQNSLFFGEARYCAPASDDFFYVGVHLHDFYVREQVASSDS